jgi:hypothetical protein
VSAYRWLIALVLAPTFVISAQGETRCPAGVASVRFPALSRNRIVVPAVVNGAGPYDFLVDTGTQFTIVDATLAAQLHLALNAKGELDGLGFRTSTKLAQVDSLQIGSEALRDQFVEVQDLGSLLSRAIHARGILGGLFLEHFELYIDYAHRQLCVGKPKNMKSLQHGVRLDFTAPSEVKGDTSLEGLVVFPVRLPSVTSRPLHFVLDSGSDQSIILHAEKVPPLHLATSATEYGYGITGIEQAFWVLPEQELKVGALTLEKVSLAISQRPDSGNSIDGLLAAGLFRSVLVNYAERFLILTGP